ncbi:glycohydrolase toxin TNT-related protein [Crystallibacter degradans]|uniref:glycohydrolase toxin TNT-related protein n=1 Tax=Crystallibacter degradans TaxID=2726743 RepID=UPI0014765422|nr:glycohydrolase toxin TNT-related protein [Arthrobacter sp. SF27]NMR29551.1 glycohydrolase toxin TNT-related protein [Arthrobacter sp. SF27]
MGWNPSEFPPLPDGDVLEQHAGKLRTKAEGIQSAAEESHTLWAGMSTAYKGPGDWQVHTAFNKVASEAEVVLEDANAVAAAIDTFAEWAREAKRRYNALYADWLAVQSRIDDGGGDWREDQDLVNDDNNILKSADALLAEHMEAERTCATAISGLFDGPSYVVTTQDGPGANQVAYGYTADQLDAAAAEGNIPWGEPTEWDKPWYRDALDGVVSFGKGVWSGITGTVTGLWNMVNFTDMETFSATWKGIGTLALDVAIVASPVAQVALRATGNKHIVDQSADRLVAVGKAAVHWDDWKRDPAYAAGASAFDLASILLTAGGGAVAKTGSVASAVTRVGSTGSRVASVVNATGLTKIAGYTGRVIDLGSALKINTVNFATDTARVTLGRVAPAAVRVDNFINDVGTSLSGPRPAYAGVPAGNGPGPVSTRIDNLINRFDAEGPAGPTRAPATQGTAASSRNAFDVDGQRINDRFRHPEAPQRGTAQPDVVSDPARHESYGLSRDDADLQGRSLENGARYPESISDDLTGIVDEKQPKFGVDENGTPLSEQEYANRYGEINDSSGALEWDSYPDNAGAVEGTIRTYDSLDDLHGDIGEVSLDRIGPNGGAYLAVDGTPWHMRSLPVNTLGKELHHFDFNDLPDGVRVEVSEIAPAFGRPGGGTQLRFLDGNDVPVGVDEAIRRGGLQETGPRTFDRPWASNADNPVDLLQEHGLKVSSRASVLDAVAKADIELEPNTVYEVAGRGKFYTNSSGNIQHVEATSGEKGGWNPELNNPRPLVRYHIDDNVVIDTDAEARPVALHAHDIEYFSKDLAENWRHESNQQKVGNLGGTDYDGGHLLAAMFGGPGEKINLIPQLNIQNRNLGLADLTAVERRKLTGNARTWYETELWIRDRLKDVRQGTAKPAVTWDVKPVYRSGDPSAVPGRVELKVTIDGQQQKFYFRNKRG